MSDVPLDEPRPETVPEQQAPVDGDTRSRLRLHHFFALTAVMAVLLAIGGPQRDMGNAAYQPPQYVVTLQVMLGIAIQIVAAVAITTLAYGIAGYRRGQLFFNQPGHWILVEVSLVTLVTIPTTLVIRRIKFDAQMTPGDTQFTLLMIMGIYSLLFLFLGRLLVNIYLGITKCRERRWKSVFFGKAAASVIFGLGDIAVIALLLSAVRTDRREQLLRNAGHWCGVYVQLAHSSLAILTVLLSVLNSVLLMRR